MEKDLREGKGSPKLAATLRSDNEKMKSTLSSFGCVKDTEVNVKGLFDEQVRNHKLQNLFTLDAKCVSNKWSIVIAAAGK